MSEIPIQCDLDKYSLSGLVNPIEECQGGWAHPSSKADPSVSDLHGRIPVLIGSVNEILIILRAKGINGGPSQEIGTVHQVLEIRILDTEQDQTMLV